MKTIGLRHVMLVFATLCFGYIVGTMLAYGWIQKGVFGTTAGGGVTNKCYECFDRLDLWLWFPVACVVTATLTLLMVWMLAEPHQCEKYNN